MANSLLTGVSGLVTHQQMLSVVGNNLANLNTTAFKGHRILFADLLYETVRPATSASNGDAGGVTPNQIGSGVKLGQITRRFSQGNLELTGGLFDFAIQGEGFFVVNDGIRNLYTRAGAFSLDKEQYLIDPSTGYHVQRLGSLGEPAPNSTGFQIPGDSRIRIPFGAIIPGKATEAVELNGNLSGKATGEKAKLLSTSSPFMVDDTTPATAATLLNDLNDNQQPYVAGDIIDISGTDADGNPVATTYTITGTSTLGDLRDRIEAAYPESTVSLTAGGNITIEANTPGVSPLNLKLEDRDDNTGFTQFGQHQMEVDVEGKEADEFLQNVDIYDVQGNEHTLLLRFVRQPTSNTWNLQVEIDEEEGTMLDGAVNQITFNDDGSLQQIYGIGDGDTDITIQFNGIAAAQTIDLDFSPAPNELQQNGDDQFLVASQDGFAPGSLTSVSISLDGVVEGVASNGRTLPLAQLAIAAFQNNNGLKGIGDNYFEESLNSGEPQLGAATSGNRGAIAGGQLESSNVDIAFEFTRLIVAQRGFSANARTITVSDQVLEELTNIIR
ncbi:MAG: flagellar hook protein FlgE [Pirellulaceae bacterium]|nr:flagellar hook protein FlgE [Planctomycetales bacterium]